jgi:hypothetical protein
MDNNISPYGLQEVDAKQFRIYGKQMVDYVADYWDNMRQHGPLHDVKPNYILDLVYLL